MKNSQKIIIIVILTVLTTGFDWSFRVSSAKAEELTPQQAKQLADYWRPFSEQTPRIKETPQLKKEQVEQCVSHALTFIINKQNPNGSWGGPYKTKRLNIYAPMPRSHNAFLMGTSSLAMASLCEWEQLAPDSVRSKIPAAIEKGQKWILDNLDSVKRSSHTSTYNNWAHIYSLSALSRLYLRAQAVGDLQLEKRLVLAMQKQVSQLAHFENIHGGWAYYDWDNPSTRPSFSTLSFTTAAGLVSLYEVSQLNISKEILPEGKIAIPQHIITRAVASIVRQQKPDFTYAYGEYVADSPLYGINRNSGSLGRSQACNAALNYWSTLRTEEQVKLAADGKKIPDTALPFSRFVTQQVMTDALDRFCARIGWLDGARKHSVPHDYFNKIAGYFYFYGHLYASEELICLDNPAEQKRLAAHLTKILMDIQDKDGSYWDFVLYDYGQSYGTGMALISLARCYRAMYGEKSDASKSI